jgi:hypothetical protein
MPSETYNGRSLTEIVADLKEETKEFVRTRVEMFKSELQEKLGMLKVAAPLGAVGALVLTTAYMLFTLAIVALVGRFFENSAYRWFLAFGIVGIAWTLLGGIALYFAKRELVLKNLVPRRTIEVLKGDKVWIESEARNRI